MVEVKNKGYISDGWAEQLFVLSPDMVEVKNVEQLIMVPHYMRVSMEHLIMGAQFI